MQLNAPRLRSPCASSKSTRSDEPDEGGNHEVIKGNQEAIPHSSKSTSSDEPAPHASRSKFRPSNGSRHLMREAIMRSSQAIKKQSRSKFRPSNGHSSRERQNVDIAAVVGAVAGVDAKEYGGGVGGGEGGLRKEESTGTQKASTRLISASSAASNSELISSSSSSSFVLSSDLRKEPRSRPLACGERGRAVVSTCMQARTLERAAISAARLLAPLALATARIVQNGDDHHCGEGGSRRLHVERHLMREAIMRSSQAIKKQPRAAASAPDEGGHQHAIRGPQRSSSGSSDQRHTSLPLSTCWITAID